MPTEVLVPDIGDFGDVPMIEVLVAAGDKVNAEDPLLTLESDKATMDVPGTVGGHRHRGAGQGRRRGLSGHPILHAAPGDGAGTTPPSLVEQQEPAPGPAKAASPWPRRSGRRSPRRPR